jgi:hypothetical protein
MLGGFREQQPSKADLVAGFQKLLEGQCPNNTAGGQGSLQIRWSRAYHTLLQVMIAAH